jgi:hypothetical protein
MDIDHLRRRLGLAPSGNASLVLLRQRLQRAEVELESALAAMRSAADAGIERSGLFSETTFVPRLTADSWHEAGQREGRREVTDCWLRALGKDPAEERADIAASIKRDRKAAEARSARWDGPDESGRLARRSRQRRPCSRGANYGRNAQHAHRG